MRKEGVEPPVFGHIVAPTEVILWFNRAIIGIHKHREATRPPLKVPWSMWIFKVDFFRCCGDSMVQ
jgi:hypothetical protein